MPSRKAGCLASREPEHPHGPPTPIVRRVRTSPRWTEVRTRRTIGVGGPWGCSGSRLARPPALRDGINQALVVTLGLIGVRTGETAQRDVQLVRCANVSRDHG